MVKIPFRVSARTARLIGKDNIASAEGAIIELVKNSFDAEADDCFVIFNIKKKGNSCIYIIDNGTGMTGDVILDDWMTIGTESKLIEPITKSKKRVKSGSKGIGRLALDRLGDTCEFVTLAKGNNKGSKWKVNWNDFDKKGLTAGQVTAELDDKIDLEFKKEVLKHISALKATKPIINKTVFNSGTIIKIDNLSDRWDMGKIDNVYNSLEILVPPKENPEFKIHLFSSLEKGAYGLVNSSFIDDYDYKLTAIVRENNKIKISIDRKEFNWNLIHPDVWKEKQPRDMSKWPYNLDTLKNGEFSFDTDIETVWPAIEEMSNGKKLINDIGPFTFTFYFMKRDYSSKRDNFAYRNFNSSKRKVWLKQFGGIKLYRDQFRVRPYGEPQSNAFDWLGLGDRAAASTFGPGQKGGKSWRVNPNQVHGVVNISRLTNIQLKDVSNRGGLHENEVYFAFRELIRQLINIIEKDRHFMIRPMSVVKRRLEETDKAKEEAIIKAKEKLADHEKKSRSKSKGNKILRLIDSEEGEQDNELTYAKGVRALEEEIIEKSSEIRELRALASLGMTIGTFTHELREISDKLKGKTNKLETALHKWVNIEKLGIIKRAENPFTLLDDIRSKNERLRNWLNFSLNLVRKDRRKATNLSLKNYFNEFLQNWSEDSIERKTKIILANDFGSLKLTKAYPIDLDAIFNNLLINSFDAFYRKDSPRRRREVIIGYELENDGISFIYQDNGPGLLKSIKDPYEIFDALFSTKKKLNEGEIGFGLGMWIVKSAIDEYNGYLEITKPRPGFILKVHFPKITK